MDTVWYLLLTLLLLSIMVVIHELGHFLFARLFKVTVYEFSIGMGPAIFTTAKKKNKTKNKSEIGDTFHSPEHGEPEEPTQAENADEDKPEKTVFSIRAFPIGGYVRMAGEDEASTDPNAFCNKAVWKRLIITVAGAVMNILLGIICMFALVGMEAFPINGTTDPLLASNVVAGFHEGSLSDKCDDPLMVGDRIIKVDGVLVHTGNELVYEIMNNGYEPIDLVVIRNGEKIVLEKVTFPTAENTGVVFGEYDFTIYGEKPNLVNIMKHAVFRSFSTVKVITDGIKDMLTGRYGAEAVSGPIGMAGAVEDAATLGFSSLLHLFTLITMNLGVFNLLPLPALDGGRIIFLLIEMIRRKPIKREVEGMINTIGLIALLGLMLIVTLKDIINLF